MYQGLVLSPLLFNSELAELSHMFHTVVPWELLTTAKDGMEGRCLRIKMKNTKLIIEDQSPK